jgi:hypothetical protein
MQLVRPVIKGLDLLEVAECGEIPTRADDKKGKDKRKQQCYGNADGV